MQLLACSNYSGHFACSIKNLFQLYPDNFQNNYFLLSDKLEDNIRYTISWSCTFITEINIFFN